MRDVCCLYSNHLIRMLCSLLLLLSRLFTVQKPFRRSVMIVGELLVGISGSRRVDLMYLLAPPPLNLGISPVSLSVIHEGEETHHA